MAIHTTYVEKNVRTHGCASFEMRNPNPNPNTIPNTNTNTNTNTNPHPLGGLEVGTRSAGAVLRHIVHMNMYACTSLMNSTRIYN